MPRRTIRLTADIDERLRSTAKVKGYANPSAFLRAAIDNELSGREDTMTGAEERLAASMERIRREIFRSFGWAEPSQPYLPSWTASPKFC